MVVLCKHMSSRMKTYAAADGNADCVLLFLCARMVRNADFSKKHRKGKPFVLLLFVSFSLLWIFRGGGGNQFDADFFF